MSVNKTSQYKVENGNAAIAVKVSSNENAWKAYQIRQTLLESEGEDVLQELRSNIQKLQTAHSKLQFMMSEISTLIRR